MNARDHVGESQPVEQQPDERELLREEIEQVREDLAETVEALANKADVKAQVHEQVQDTKAHVHEKVHVVKAQITGGEKPGAQPGLRETLNNPALPGAIAALAAVLLVRSILRRR